MQQGGTCGQLFLVDFNFLHFRGLVSKKLAYIALAEFFEIFVVPRKIHSDKDKELTLAQYLWWVCKNQARLHTTDIDTLILWKNSDEQGVRIIKRCGARLIRNIDDPTVVWEWTLDYEAKFNTFTVSPISWLHGRTPHEHMMGEKPDITELFQFSWYGLVYYWSQHSFPDGKKCLGRFLGITHNVVSDMCYYIFSYQPETGKTKIYLIQQLLVLQRKSLENRNSRMRWKH